MFVDKQGGEHGEELGLLLTPSVIPLRARGKGVSRHAFHIPPHILIEPALKPEMPCLQSPPA